MWTKGLPLLSSPPFSFLASFDYSFAPRRASRIPFPPFSFFSWMGLGEPRKTLSLLRRARVVLILSGGLPPLLLHCRSTFTSSSSSSPLLPSTNCFFSINFVSWDAYRLHEQLPRRLPPAISLSFSRPLRRPLIARTWLLFLPKNCTVPSRDSLPPRDFAKLDVPVSSILDINRIFSGERDWEGPAFVVIS